MEYLTCPVCQARLHGGLLYEPTDSCPRCGTRFGAPPPGRLERLRGKVTRRRTIMQPPDWEQITRSQYDDRRYVSRADIETNGAERDGSPGGHGQVKDVV